MSKRKDIFDKIVDIVKHDDDFKQIFVNVAPTWANVRMFPACAVIMDKEEIEIKEYNCSTDRELSIIILIYNKHSNNDYSDILSDLLDNLESKLKDNDDLKDLTTITYPESISQDGGILHPYTMAEMVFKVKYFVS